VDDFQKLEFDEIVQRWMWLSGLVLIILGVLLGLVLRRPGKRRGGKHHTERDKASNGNSSAGAQDVPPVKSGRAKKAD
jgi:hypothetical protein